MGVCGIGGVWGGTGVYSMGSQRSIKSMGV